MTFEIDSVDELSLVSQYILKKFPNGVIVLLKGDLGAGKSTLVKNFAKIKNPKITTNSPTFTIAHEYGDNIFHYDLYRIGSKEFIQRGLIETLENSGWHFLEWADKKIETCLSAYGINWVTISIKQDKSKRIFNVT